MGRAKITMEYIRNQPKRRLVEKKRQFGFIRKGVELNRLTGTNVFAFSQTEDGIISIFTSNGDVAPHLKEIYQKLTSDDQQMHVSIYGPDNALELMVKGRQFTFMRKGGELNRLAGTNIFAFTQSKDGAIGVFTSKSDISVHLQEILLYMKMATADSEIYVQIYTPEIAHETFRDRKIVYKHPDANRRVKRRKRTLLEISQILPMEGTEICRAEIVGINSMEKE